MPASYAVYMFDLQQQTWLIVAAPPAGFMYTDPIALQSRARAERARARPLVDATLAAQNLALIEVRSVYDTDGLQRMGETRCWPPPTCRAGLQRTASRRPRRRPSRPKRATRWPTWRA